MISGKSFADMCTWIYDSRYRERPFLHWGSRQGDWVFINGDHLDQFLSIRLATPKRFNLIIHKGFLTKILKFKKINKKLYY